MHVSENVCGGQRLIMELILHYSYVLVMKQRLLIWCGDPLSLTFKVRCACELSRPLSIYFGSWDLSSLFLSFTENALTASDLSDPSLHDF